MNKYFFLFRYYNFTLVNFKLYSIFLHVFVRVSFLFSVSAEKYENTCFDAKTNDFDKRTVCGAPVGWSKYKTVDASLQLLHYTNIRKIMSKYNEVKSKVKVTLRLL